MAIYSGFTHWKWWFSIVMLVYQRVLNIEMTGHQGKPAGRSPDQDLSQGARHRPWQTRASISANQDGQCTSTNINKHQQTSTNINTQYPKITKQLGGVCITWLSSYYIIFVTSSVPRWSFARAPGYPARGNGWVYSQVLYICKKNTWTIYEHWTHAHYWSL